MKKFVKTIPIATCGIALALAALGNLLLLPFGSTVRYLCGVLSLIVLIIFALKLFLDPKHVKEELKTPIPLSVLPTATMAIMLLSTYIRSYIPNTALIIWYLAGATHVIIMLVFIKKFVIGFSLGTVFPSWFITGIGIVTVSVTAPAMNAAMIGQIAFYLGLILYFAILPLVVLRMNKVRVFPEPARKTIAIFTAPMSLLIVGYFQSFVAQGQVTPLLVYFMLAIAVVSYIYVSVMMFSLLKIKFYPTYAAFTFPYVISALAFRLGANFLATRHGFYFLTDIANITMWIAVIVVVFVLVHYVKYFKFWLKF